MRYTCDGRKCSKQDDLDVCSELRVLVPNLHMSHVFVQPTSVIIVYIGLRTYDRMKSWFAPTATSLVTY